MIVNILEILILRLKQLREEERPNHFAWISELLVTGKDGNNITTLRPEKRIYFIAILILTVDNHIVNSIYIQH
ncbi:MAG: hypothetical protein CM1200mP10_15570 [Candidatus Neomarinimicrobiota bacterium]|nr:MAG: hypothetical protein CM1200mP10_15570 [Candidatus Neomarinimicrobiota bacterium]